MEKPAHIQQDEEAADQVKKEKQAIVRKLSRQLSQAGSEKGLPLLRQGSVKSSTANDAGNEDDDNEGEEEVPSAPIKKILMLSRPEWPGMFVGAICTLLSVVPESLVPLLFGWATTALKSSAGVDEKISSVNRYMFMLVGLMVVGTFLKFIQGSIFSVAGERVILRLREQLLEAIMSSDVSKLDKTQSGVLISRLTTDVMNVQSVATESMVSLFTNFVKIVLQVVIMFTVSWKLTTAICVSSPLLWVIIFPLSNKMGQLSEQYQDELAEATSCAQETIANFRTVRAFAAERYAVDRYINKLGNLKKTRCWWMRDKSVYRLGVIKGLVENAFGPTMETLFMGVLYGTLWYALILAAYGQFDTGLIFTFLMYAVQIMETMGGLGETFGSFVTASSAAGKVFALLDAKPEIPIRGGKRLDQVLGEVTFKDVHFTYPGNDKETLSGLVCTIPPQSSAAFVGASGCGKSTLLRLLERFYDVSKGSVCIDGIDVRELDGSWIRTNVSFVQQEPNLFAMSVRDNVNYGHMAFKRNMMDIDPISQTATTLTSVVDSGTSDTESEAIVKACKNAHAHDFIEKLQDGYDTTVGERGMKLSGGQKQRVAIARAIIQNPKIMLLDEATSALDAESEHLVSEAINFMMKGRTVLLVAHRLSTVKNATSIHFVKDGKILDSGPHQALLQRCQDYMHLVEHQMA